MSNTQENISMVHRKTKLPCTKHVQNNYSNTVSLVRYVASFMFASEINLQV